MFWSHRGALSPHDQEVVLVDFEERERYLHDVALARYGVIAPLICRKLSREELREEVDRVADVFHAFPEGFRKVSRRSVRRWCRYYRSGRELKDGTRLPEGLDSLRPIGRSDRGQPRVLSSEVLERAVQLRLELPSRKTGRLMELIENEAQRRNEEPPELKESTLNYHLRNRGVTRRRLRTQDRAFRRFEHPYRSSCWQGDWTDGIWLPHPQRPTKMRKCFLHAFIDDHSRFVPHAEFYFRQNLPCLEDAFRKAVLKGGIPERTYVDQGSTYQSRQFKTIAGRLGTHLIYATEYSPEGTGKIERWNETFKDDFLDEVEHAGLKTLHELNTSFWGWLDRCYHSRVHSTTGETPRDRWERGVDRMRCVDPADLIDIFLWEENRTVDKAGCFKLGGNEYAVAEHLVREQIQVRFDPFDLDLVRVYHRGVFIETVSPYELVKRTYHKALPRRKEKPAVLESSAFYREQFSKAHHQQLQATMDQIGAGTEPNPQGYMNHAEWTRLLMDGLGRQELRAHEKTLLFQFFQRYAPLPQAVVTEALSRAVDEKGNRLHLRVYLRRIREAVASARKRKGGE